MKTTISTTQAKKLITDKLSHFFGVAPDVATDEQFYKAVAMIVRDELSKKNSDFRHTAKGQDSKEIYYLCMEFLMGRSLKNNLYNLGLTETFDKALSSMGVKLDNLYEQEPDAGLGNGGLGRLAACYLDGLATTGFQSMGYSLRYEAGIFKQKLIDGWQTELPDFWLPGGEVWLVPREERSCKVAFEGYIEDSWDGDFHHVNHKDANVVEAIPYDMYVSGKGEGVSRLRLWAAKKPELDMTLFNEGSYMKAMEQSAMAEAITKVLYPADNSPEGKSLRLRQQYFLVSASIQDIIQRHLTKYGTLDNLPDKVAIHINDTHPTMAIPELMRIMLDECGYSWDDAWSIVTRTVAYTNHTVMKEALECWSEELYSRLLPRIYQITKEIDNRFRAYVWSATYDADRVERMAVVSNGVVRMANLCVIGSHSVNGVSALHSGILKETVFNDFYNLTPEKFCNVTNGIAFRRWICQANPALTNYITSLIGDGFITKSDELEKLRQFKDDKKVLAKLDEIKHENKVRFAKIIKKRNGVDINPDSIFDVQVKRLHEYKRQQLNILNIISEYQMLKENPNADYYPKTYIFASKAAPGYFMAKKLIQLIDALSNVINNDPDVNDKLKVVFLEDYNVSLAEVLMPAADISEQISLAGTEASGTGNMKLMLNGAITLGTLDGANVEIHDAVGEDNIYVFGMKTPEVEQLKKAGYFPQSYIQNNEALAKAMAFLQNGVNGKKFDEVYYSLVNTDPYMALADFTDYQRAQREISKAYADREKFVKMSLMNISGAGIFSADRSIMDYANNIWHTKPVQFAKETPKATKKSKPMAPKSETKAEPEKEEKKEAKAEPKKVEKKAEKKVAPKKEAPKAPAKKPASKSKKK
ncbi:glycogen/starch/alpha-glucan phosphorylase [Eubacterium coprostanoligenes]|uniref:glycogen/starch/alpha-glucan phosphorylase n=1 Tax=Eubacterium coprostanoligenes TaxID=290054 RepID=UPI0023535F61|nr:glycogen/starch/alpha-glucan phosphorylase [Eubacterium coprostanoligenes]MCI6354814.1 glycogen/starch/alpha-glucan phosphorylase [Eubacterium coprostanoligenes]